MIYEGGFRREMCHNGLLEILKRCMANHQQCLIARSPSPVIQTAWSWDQVSHPLYYREAYVGVRGILLWVVY